MKILVIEDDAGTRAMIAAVLRREGFLVELAENGRAGLERAGAWRPDLVLSDIDMPELDGFGVLNGLRAHADLADVPIIFLTVFEDREVFRHSMKLGVDDFLNKPIKPDELLDAVSTRLAKHKTAELARQRRNAKTSVEEEELALMYSRYLAGESGARFDGVTTQQILAANQKSMVVTAMVASIRNFSAYADVLTEEESKTLLQACFNAICPTVQQWGGTINRFIGEGFLAIFGGTGLDAHAHARHALHAAAGIVRETESFATWTGAHFPRYDLPPLRITVAVSTGEVTFFEQRDRTQGIKVTGDAVSWAARFESRAKELGWNIITGNATLSSAGLGVRVGARDVMRSESGDKTSVIEVLGMPAGEVPHNAARLDQAISTALAENSARAVPAMRAALDAHRERLQASSNRLPTFPGYRLMEKIGQGGMSEVWRAERVADGQVLVLKLLDLSTSHDDLLRRFLHEYALVSKLNHRNVVKIFDQGITDRWAYIAMEYFGGGDLAQVMARGLVIDQVVAFGGMAAEALAAIHAVGIVHRDVKPANLMLRDDGSLALCDFGIAKELAVATGFTRHGEIIGTPQYISPEQIKGLVATAQSDLYSLGIMLFEMFQGKRPFQGGTLDEILAQHMMQPVPALTGKPAAFQAVIEKLLAKDATQRHASAKAFLADWLRVQYA